MPHVMTMWVKALQEFSLPW